METEAVELLRQRVRVLERELEKERRKVQELQTELRIMHEVAQQTRERVPMRMSISGDTVVPDNPGTADIATERF